MPPRHFWWLVETLNPAKGAGRLSEADKREFVGWLDGNDTGGF